MRLTGGDGYLLDIRQLNRNYFHTKDWQNVSYKGKKLFKYPSDLITYQEIIFDTKPEIIIETGTCRGASPLFFYDTMVANGIKKPLVITIDTKIYPNRDKCGGNIQYLKGSSLDVKILSFIEKTLNNKSVMVSLDSDHIRDHVFAELNAYSKFVTSGNYLVVEDTFLGEYGVFTNTAEERFRPDTGKTPKDAVEDFLKINNKFTIDKSRNKILSMNPNGYLKRND